MPSHFVWPELVALAQRQERQALTVIYSLPQMHEEGRPPAAPEEVLRLLRSAGDPTRLQILQLLAQRARSTQEIAGLVKLSDAAISKHLKLLLEAGWVDADRHSYYVYYRLQVCLPSPAPLRSPDHRPAWTAYSAQGTSISKGGK